MNTAPTTVVASGFEFLRQANEHNAEYWRAHDLQPLLGYPQWRRFEQAIEQAMASCEASGNKPGNYFAGAGEIVDLDSGSKRFVKRYHAVRFACHSVAVRGHFQ